MTIQKFFLFFALFLFIFLPERIVFANDLPGRFQYPIELYRAGDYYRSISEIKRLRFQFPERSARHRLHLYLLKNYYRMKEHDQVLQGAKELFLRPSLRSDPEVVREVGKILTFSLLEQGEEKKADDVWKSIVRDTTTQVPKSQDIPGQVDPARAKRYSTILPGAGLFLTGEYRKGTVSFLLNALFLAGIYHSLQEKQHATAGLLFFFEWSWYIGGQNAAVESANNHNRRLIQKAQNDWINRVGFSIH